MGLMNRLANCGNKYQGAYKRVLCVCSAGLLRSPTAAVVLSQEPFNYNTRAAGLSEDYGLIQIDAVLLTWADEIVCMEPHQEETLRARLREIGETQKPVICLNIPDDYGYRDPVLMQMIADNYAKVHKNG